MGTDRNAHQTLYLDKWCEAPAQTARQDQTMMHIKPGDGLLFVLFRGGLLCSNQLTTKRITQGILVLKIHLLATTEYL